MGFGALDHIFECILRKAATTLNTPFDLFISLSLIGLFRVGSLRLLVSGMKVEFLFSG